MRSKLVRRTSVLAAIAITVAVAATRHPSEDPEAPLKARIARLQAELAKLRSARTTPEQERPTAAPTSPAEPVPEAARDVEVPLSSDQIGAFLRSKNRKEQRLGLQALESIGDRGEKLALLRAMVAGGDLSMT